ncbi:polysaccharide deacetylase family protein [Pelomonas sp. KK5]|uniref:polysaccharide deacetylase family protein n=1 Tax=Pelomonas sp. KK5 TaxID=1855730 RepID=UPI00097C8B48|nr:polysaccharide deacetylase family protein [Pelomonas sp. KK5]
MTSKQVSFCFDDGFRRSAETVCQVFEQRGLKACFAILADPGHALDPFVRGADLGDWAFWRQVMAAGHELGSHGLMHERYDELGIEAARASVLRALAAMEARLPGFRRRDAVFHVPYLSAPDELVRWLGEDQSLAVRLGPAAAGFNRWSELRRGAVINCVCFGPEGVGESLAARLQQFSQQAEDGWLVLVLHGVDGEGWGPVTRAQLERLLDDALAAGITVATPNATLAAFL